MIHHGDLFDVLPTFEPNSIDAVVTDPPYGIGFMGKEWDTFKPGAAKVAENKAIESDNPNLKGRQRSPATSPSQIGYDFSVAGLRGFEAWTEKWATEVFRVLKPGGYLLVCGAPRSFHRMTCGLEDAGFEIRDCLSWLFGTGFPKSLNVSKAIDKAAGAERPVVGYDASRARPNRLYEGGAIGNIGGTGKISDRTDNGATLTAAATDEAQTWDGWGTALKPGWEPIIVARKPIDGTVAANILRYGTGALNIDACRIDGPLDDADRPNRFQKTTGGWKSQPYGNQEVRSDGRWPANVVLDEDAAALLDAQSGELGVSSGGAINRPWNSEMYGPGSKTIPGDPGFGDSGGASRFYYVAKPSREERDYGTQGLTAKQRDESRKDGNPGGDNPRNRGLQRRGNHHPTVKPIELMRWLIKLVTPPDGVVLDPFTGSGTTGMACRYEHRKFIGIEKEAEYVAIAEARIGAVAPLFGGE